MHHTARRFAAVVAALVGAAVMSASVAGCDPYATPATDTVTLSVSSLHNPFFRQLRSGAPEAAHAMPRGTERAPHTRESSLGPRCLARPPCLHPASTGADGGRVAPDTVATPCPWTTLTTRVIMAENLTFHPI